MKVITHPSLGRIMPSQAPIAQSFGEDDDWDMSLYTDGPAWMVKIEIDYYSKLTFKTETIEKEILVTKEFLESRGVGAFVAEFEKTFDQVANTQLTFIPFHKITELRRALMDLINPESVKHILT